MGVRVVNGPIGIREGERVGGSIRKKECGRGTGYWHAPFFPPLLNQHPDQKKKPRYFRFAFDWNSGSNGGNPLVGAIFEVRLKEPCWGTMGFKREWSRSV